MFVWYLDRTGKMAPYQLQGIAAAHFFPTRDYANACAEQLVREQFTRKAIVLTIRGQVADEWQQKGRKVRHVQH